MSVIMRPIIGLTGAAISIEALALLIGIRLLGAANEWTSAKNDVLLALDIVTGVGLMLLAWRSAASQLPALLYLITAVALATHAYRESEYPDSAQNPF